MQKSHESGGDKDKDKNKEKATASGSPQKALERLSEGHW
jgi:hypothetical protein